MESCVSINLYNIQVYIITYIMNTTFGGGVSALSTPLSLPTLSIISFLDCTSSSTVSSSTSPLPSSTTSKMFPSDLIRFLHGICFWFNYTCIGKSHCKTHLTQMNASRSKAIWSRTDGLIVERILEITEPLLTLVLNIELGFAPKRQF